MVRGEHPICHYIPRVLKQRGDGGPNPGTGPAASSHTRAHIRPSHPDTATSLLGLCKAFSFDCLVPCVRGRILSTEKSLVRASAAVERKQTWSHPLLPGEAPSGPRNTRYHPEWMQPVLAPIQSSGMGCPDTAVAGPRRPPSVHSVPRPVVLHGATWALHMENLPRAQLLSATLG